MLQLHGGLGLGLALVLGFYSVRHLMNGWDLKYTFPDILYVYFVKLYNCMYIL